MQQLSLVQLWKEGRSRFRPRGELARKADFRFDVIHRDFARLFVERHHYLGSMPAARLSVGMFERATETLVGVAVFSQPSSQKSVPKRTGLDPQAGINLGRFVLLDRVPTNGETMFLGQAFRLLRRAKPDVRAVVSYSDPMERTTSAGEVVMPGHWGCIYQAHNGRYVGRTKGETVYLTADGRSVQPRSLSKLRNGEKGGGAYYETLLEMGAPERRRGEHWRTWATRSLDSFRRHRHPGNHVYVWGLDRRSSRSFPSALPYPKPVVA
jgi:hypothetical protein